MQKDTLGKVGLAAVILLAPGGFILGGALAARYYRNRLASQAEPDATPPAEVADGDGT